MAMFLNVSVNSITWLYVLMKYYFRLGNNALCPSKSGDIVRIMSERERESRPAPYFVSHKFHENVLF